MLGAIAVDIIGSVYEHSPIKTKRMRRVRSCITTFRSAHAKGQVLHYDISIRECLIVRPDPGLAVYGQPRSTWRAEVVNVVG
jgi:hypothetical protein